MISTSHAVYFLCRNCAYNHIALNAFLFTNNELIKVTLGLYDAIYVLLCSITGALLIAYNKMRLEQQKKHNVIMKTQL